MMTQNFTSSLLDHDTTKKLFGRDQSSYIIPDRYQIPTKLQRENLNTIVGMNDIVIHLGGYGLWSHDLIMIAKNRLILGVTNNVAEQNIMTLVDTYDQNMKSVIKIAKTTNIKEFVQNIGERLTKAPSSFFLITLEPPLMTDALILELINVFKNLNYGSEHNGSVWILLSKTVTQSLLKRKMISKNDLFKMVSVRRSNKGLVKETEHIFYTTDDLSRNRIFVDHYTGDELRTGVGEDGLCQWMK